MPSVQVFLNTKLSHAQKADISRCIVDEIATKLNKPKHMIGVFLQEVSVEMTFPKSAEHTVIPTVQLCAGGITSGEQMESCMYGISEAFCQCGICPAKAVRIYITPPEKGHFSMGGNLL